ncbi:fimbrial protein [Yersinia bercovieri]|uniref:fimbrial protein n=1 Tax=Yersinia bercovieri TaxID=634 RepID=UPI0005DBA374|nr:fimbrial protein [Yersinia bercovieri]MDN0101378.1 fimbrial protein [Yersinia bercovieri]CNI53665.1 Minor fimbrial protein prsF precursor [Yersinia bercovieri]
MKRLMHGMLLCTLLWSVHGQAATLPITIKATILEPVCTVTGNNGESAVEVPFGELTLEQVGTAAAEQSVNLKMSCDNSAPTGKTLKMYLSPTSYGVMSEMGANVLSTSLNGLGIALTSGKAGTTPVNLNSWVPVEGMGTGESTVEGQLQLKAQLVTPSIAQLHSGTFQATASLMINYQ